MKTVTISNQKMIKILNWFNTTGRWITIQLYIVLQMLGVTALVCWAAIKYVPPKWDWGVVITQCVAFLLSTFLVGDNIRKHTSWYYKHSIIHAWFHTDSTKMWRLDSRPWQSSFWLMKLLVISLKYNAIVLAAISVIYAAVELLSMVDWRVEHLYGVMAGFAFGLAMYVLHIINRKIREFIRFCREMLAINRLIKESRPHEGVIRDRVVNEWMRKSSRLSQIDGSFLADWQGSLDTKIRSAGLAILSTSFKVKPAGEYATRAAILEAAEELEKIGRGLIHDQQVADAHLFRVRKKHEDSKKPAKPTEAMAS